MSENVTFVKPSMEDRCVRLIGLMAMAKHAAERMSRDDTVKKADRREMGTAARILQEMISEASETLLSIRKARNK